MIDFPRCSKCQAKIWVPDEVVKSANLTRELADAVEALCREAKLCPTCFAYRKCANCNERFMNHDENGEKCLFDASSFKWNGEIDELPNFFDSMFGIGALK